MNHFAGHPFDNADEVCPPGVTGRTRELVRRFPDRFPDATISSLWTVRRPERTFDVVGVRNDRVSEQTFHIEHGPLPEPNNPDSFVDVDAALNHVADLLS
jgi:hypothetical protein